MKAEQVYKQLGEESSPGDVVAVIDKNSSRVSTIKNIKVETHEDTGQRTVWIEVEES